MYQRIATFAIVAIALTLAALFIAGGPVSATVAACPGDFDGNRRVDIDDFFGFCGGLWCQFCG